MSEPTKNTVPHLSMAGANLDTDNTQVASQAVADQVVAEGDAPKKADEERSRLVLELMIRNQQRQILASKAKDVHRIMKEKGCKVSMVDAMYRVSDQSTDRFDPKVSGLPWETLMAHEEERQIKIMNEAAAKGEGEESEDFMDGPEFEKFKKLVCNLNKTASKIVAESDLMFKLRKLNAARKTGYNVASTNRNVSQGGPTNLQGASDMAIKGGDKELDSEETKKRTAGRLAKTMHGAADARKRTKSLEANASTTHILSRMAIDTLNEYSKFLNEGKAGVDNAGVGNASKPSLGRIVDGEPVVWIREGQSKEFVKGGKKDDDDWTFVDADDSDSESSIISCCSEDSSDDEEPEEELLTRHGEGERDVMELPRGG